MIENPRGRRLAICASHRMDLEPFRDVAEEEIELGDDLARFIDTMSRRDAR